MLSRVGSGRIEFFVDGGEGAEKETARVGHDGAAPGRDFVGGEELVEFAKDMVDVRGGVELLDAAHELFGEVAGVDFLEAERGVAKAEAGFWVQGGETAVSSGADAMAAAGPGCQERIGFHRRLAAAGFGCWSGWIGRRGERGAVVPVVVVHFLDQRDDRGFDGCVRHVGVPFGNLGGERRTPLRGEESCPQMHERKGVKAVSVVHAGIARERKARKRKGIKEKQKAEGRKMEAGK